MVTEKETHILSIEQKLEQLGEEEVDKEQLLEDLQSDKTALSRAMAQNKQLKHQLAELQNGFVTLVSARDKQFSFLLDLLWQ